MARKLKDDQINLDIFINTSEAQKSIRQFNGAIRHSEATIRAHRKAMSELAAQGKRDSEEYKRLEKAIQSERNAIRLNTESLKAQTGALHNDQLTMNQLRNHVRSIRQGSVSAV
jgi:hypothetical protein